MFNLNEYRDVRQKHIEAGLEAVLPPESVEPTLLHQAMRYAVFTGGKRLRPLLAIAAAEAVGGSLAQALPPGLALELLHTYTLIHDDLPAMDDDDLRRGQPTVHKVYGEANAILVGDALQALAFEVLAKEEQAGIYVHELAHAGGSQGVVGGQWVDIASEGKVIGESTLEYINEHKTAALLRASVRLGAISAKANEEQLAILSTYGTAIGHAFQLVDDLLDADREEDKPTAVAVYGLEKTREQAQQFVAQAEKSLAAIPHAEPLAAIAQFIIDRTK